MGFGIDLWENCLISLFMEVDVQSLKIDMEFVSFEWK